MSAGKNLNVVFEVVRILKKKDQEMSRSGKVSRTFEFFSHIFKCIRAAEKSQGAAKKKS